jgi:hypothetical protein
MPWPARPSRYSHRPATKKSSLLNIALHTVEKHRRMARKKLNLANKGINLRTYLSSL